jgi:hypothetical protein
MDMNAAITAFLRHCRARRDLSDNTLRLTARSPGLSIIWFKAIPLRILQRAAYAEWLTTVRTLAPLP